MIKQAQVFLLLAIVILGVSCTSTKQLVYFNDLEKVKQASLMSSPQDNAEHKIETNEMLSIRITSPTTEKSAYEMLNVTNDIKGGYLIDNGGNIEIPLLGAIKAAGLTKSQLKEAILKQISDRRILIDPIVDIRFMNYEITVLGEVAKPTVITVPNEKISLLKAIGLAGDITTFGKKDNVMIIRESEGKKVVTRVNLNSSTFLQSPYYYLQPNDIVYVETTSNRAASIDKTRIIIPAILSTLSLIVVAIKSL
jgi:polysaccharide export outer membrane protein